MVGRRALAGELDRSNRTALACSGCERFDDSPSVPSCPTRWRPSASWPATCAGRGTPRPRTSSRLSTPTRGSPRRTTRSGCWAPSPPARLAELAEDKQLPAAARAGRGRPRQVPHRRPLVPAALQAADGAAVDRLLLPGVRHHQRAAAVLRRPRHPGRRPPQDRQRPRRPDRRRRAALPARATSGSRCPARAGSRRPTRCSTPTGCRSPCCARPTARAAKVTHRPARRRSARARASGSPRSAGCRCCCSTPTSRRTREPLREVTDRLYGGGERAPAAPGDAARHRRRARAPAHSPDHRRAGARGLPHQRGPRRLPRPRADPRALRGRRRPAPGLRRGARGRPRRHRVHHAHPGAGRHRPVPARPDRAVLRRQHARCPASRSTGSSRSAPRTTTAATRACSTWP